MVKSFSEHPDFAMQNQGAFRALTAGLTGPSCCSPTHTPLFLFLCYQYIFGHYLIKRACFFELCMNGSSKLLVLPLISSSQKGTLTLIRGFFLHDSAIPARKCDILLHEACPVHTGDILYSECTLKYPSLKSHRFIHIPA